ncbi:MAG: hypothetical protein C0616_01290 [Desulfuromonas sp.]|nr:MAG: hypothetical protein C0616_01290 [Desulfuromonas sp.]
MSVESIISLAGNQRRVLRLTILDGSRQEKVIEVEPYSRQRTDQGFQLLCRDRIDPGYRIICLTDILAAELTPYEFVPRLPVTV